MHGEHKTWLPFIAVGVALSVVLSFSAAGSSQASTPEPDVVHMQASAPVSAEEYQDQVRDIIEQFRSVKDAQTARQALLDLTVPGVHRSVHLSLVLILDQAVAGATEGALEQIQQLRQAYPWLVP